MLNRLIGRFARGKYCRMNSIRPSQGGEWPLTAESPARGLRLVLRRPIVHGCPWTTTEPDAGAILVCSLDSIAFRGQGAVVPNIYYCNGLANNDLGILRAVLSWEECRSLLKLFSVQYAGLQFPTMTQQDQGFAVLNLLKGELDDTWRVGFYSFDADLLQIEEWIQTCVVSRNPLPGRKVAD